MSENQAEAPPQPPPPTKRLSRDEILGAIDSRLVKVDVPEWGGHVFVRSMTGLERDTFEGETALLRKNDPSKKVPAIRARLLARVMVDEEGKRLFTDTDIPNLANKSAKALDRLFAVAESLSGMTMADLEELAKNFVPGPSDGSTSG